MLKMLMTDDETSVLKAPCYDVVPINRVLGSAPVMRSYRSTLGTIPSWAIRCQVDSFPVGVSQAGSPLGQCEGSTTFVLNDLGLKF